MNDNSFLFWLGIVADICQLESYEILLNDFDNHDLMNFLEHQDELLTKIINQNEKIIHLLEGGK